jgi:tetratricopeptide (TPR) repeat protein/transcriptional regulator with XRE-family HTH domain
MASVSASVGGGLGDLLRARRIAAGLTQEQLAERSGLSVRAIRDIERGRTGRPYRRSVGLLSGALGLSDPAHGELVSASQASPAETEAPAREGQPERVVPRQLPVAIRHFAGRADELTVLDGLLDEALGVPGTVVISAIGGTPGVGKSALAVHWGHRVAGLFPDGQLYVNLRGFDPSGVPLTPAAALRGFLAALSVPATAIPVSMDAQAGLFRSLLAGKRMLILLDNARDTEQVRPLLPASATCSVIVTSRNTLAGLAVTEGAHLLSLDVLTEAEARELLSCRLGSERVQDEPRAVSELIGLCAGLPLALAVVAARAAAGPSSSLAELVEELRHAHDRLDLLDAGDAASSVRVVFSWSYQSLSDPAARMFRLLGAHPGPDVGVLAAASLARVGADQARQVLKELTLANLLAECPAGRFAFHDLLRAYAAELARRPENDADCRAAMHRVLDFYLQTAWAADRLLHPTRSPLSLPPPQPGVIPEEFSTYSEALRWLQVEHQALLAAITRAADTGFGTHAWQISSGLRTFFDRQGHWQDWSASQHIGLTAAQRAGDVAGQANAHRDLGLARTRLGSYPDARAHLRQALELYRQIGDRVSQGHTHHDVARIFEAEGRPGDALGQCEKALQLYRKAGHPIGEARALNAIGWYHAVLGNPSQTLIDCQQPLATFREVGDPHGEASTWDSLGYAHFILGHPQQAIVCYQQALHLFRDLGDRYFHAYMLDRVGDAHDAAGDRRAARNAWQQALTNLDELRHPDASRVRAKLGSCAAGT